jgi:hypothetical protein
MEWNTYSIQNNKGLRTKGLFSFLARCYETKIHERTDADQQLESSVYIAFKCSQLKRKEIEHMPGTRSWIGR